MYSYNSHYQIWRSNSVFMATRSLKQREFVYLNTHFACSSATSHMCVTADSGVKKGDEHAVASLATVHVMRNILIDHTG